MELKTYVKNFYSLCSEDENIAIKKELKINIPLYQRPYRWGEDEHDYLIENLIKDFTESKESHFTGSVITVPTDVNCDFIDLIDGQQRITTIFLMNYVYFEICKDLVREYLEKGKKYSTVKTFITKLMKSSKYLFLDNKDFIDNLNILIVKIEEYINDSEDYPEALKLKKKQEYKNDYLRIIDFNYVEKKLRLKYTRENFNEILKQVFSEVSFVVENRSFLLRVPKEKNNGLYESYFNALKKIFIVIQDVLSDEDKIDFNNIFETKSNILEFIEEMTDNLHVCRIHTDTQDTAYTMFEVLNDRSLSLDELELIKNIFYKYFYISKKLEENFETKLNNLDKIWQEEVFFPGTAIYKKNIILFLSASYITNKKFELNKKQDIRKKIEARLKGIDNYTFNQINDDFNIFKKMSIFIKVFDFKDKKRDQEYLKAEYQKESITSRVIKLLWALKYENMLVPIIKKIMLFSNEKDISIDGFENFLNGIKQGKIEIPSELQILSENLWKAIIMSKDYKKPLLYVKRIIKDDTNYSLKREELEPLEDEFKNWVTDWRYKSTNKKNVILRILFYQLLKTEVYENTLNKSDFSSSYSLEDVLQLDHIEPLNPQEENKEKYFYPKNGEKRDDFINRIGNFMILPPKVNNKISNMSVQEKFTIYKKTPHWSFGDDGIWNFLENEKVPKEGFFLKREEQLIKWFNQIINKNLFL